MRLLREPLLHFLLLGTALFTAARFLSGAADGPAAPIVVKPGQVEHLATGFARTWQRPPTAEELDGLVDDWIREEIYYREALAMGLDRDDVIVRRRMRQKMEFVTEEVGGIAMPSDAELQAYLAAHPGAFRTESRTTFRHLYLNPARRGDAAERDAATLLARLDGAGADAHATADALMLPEELQQTPRGEISRLFGEAFATHLEQVEPGRWAGPITSGYGLHIVFVQQREDGRLPALAEVREAVVREWSAARRKDVVEAAYRRLRERYSVTVELPSGTRDELATAR